MLMRTDIIRNILKGFVHRLKPKPSVYKKAGLSWFAIKYIKHLPENKVNTVKLLGKKINVYGHVGFLHALQEIFFDEIYKIDLPEQPYIIDCGANIGLSVIYLKQHYPDARIVAFEPDTLNFELLQKNIKNFDLEKVELRKEAVWIENTDLSFSNDGTMGSKITEAGSHHVKAARLADLLIQKIDFLKIDIEGAEYTVLKDIADRLHYVQSFFLEYHGSFAQRNELVEIFSILNKAGFNFYIREAATVYRHPFTAKKSLQAPYDVQLNIFCFRK